MLTILRSSALLLLALAVLSPAEALANNILDAPLWDVVGVNGSQMLPPPAAVVNPIQVEPGALPVRWPNEGSLMRNKRRHGRHPQSEQHTPDIPMITPMPAAPAGI